MKLVYKVSFLSGLLIGVLLIPVTTQAAQGEKSSSVEAISGAFGAAATGAGFYGIMQSKTGTGRLAGLAALGAGLYSSYISFKEKSQALSQSIDADAAKALKEAIDFIITMTSLSRDPSVPLNLTMAFTSMIPVLQQAQLLNSDSYQAGKEKLRQFLESLLLHTTHLDKDTINALLASYPSTIIEVYQFLALYCGHINPLTGQSINQTTAAQFITSNNLHPLNVALGSFLLAKIDPGIKIIMYQRAFQAMIPITAKLFNGPEHVNSLNIMRDFIRAFLILMHDDVNIRLLARLFQEHEKKDGFVTLLYEYIALEYASVNAAGQPLSGKEVNTQLAKLNVTLQGYELTFLIKESKIITQLIQRSDQSFASYRKIFKQMVPIALIATRSNNGVDVLRRLLQELFIKDETPDIARDIASYDVEKILQTYGYSAITYGGIEPLTGKDLSPEEAKKLAEGYEPLFTTPKRLLLEMPEAGSESESEESECETDDGNYEIDKSSYEIEAEPEIEI